MPHTACLRCLIEEPPTFGDVDTCDTAGVLGPAVGVIASWAALEAMKILTGKEPHLELTRFNLWDNERQFLHPPKSRCRYCTEKITEFLDARWTLKASQLCGLEGVQIRVNPPGKLDFEALQKRLGTRTGSPWKQRGMTLKGRDGDWDITLFQDGRALIHGPITPERARSWYTEVVGC